MEDENGEKKFVNKLVIIYLKDLTHEFIDLGEDANQITTFEGASLFKNYICYPIEAKTEVRAQGKTLWRWTKNFRVFDFREAKEVWKLDDCEYVLFCGREASALKTVKFKEMLKKLRTEAPPPEESDIEEEKAAAEAGEDDFTPRLNLKDEDVDDLDSDADEEERKNCSENMEVCVGRNFRLYNGIMVIKSKFIDRKNEDEKKPAAEGEAEADGEDGADAADKDGAQ